MWPLFWKLLEPEFFDFNFRGGGYGLDPTPNPPWIKKIPGTVHLTPVTGALEL